VQVFLPSTDFDAVAACLDRQRLNKQALEAWQIMMCNVGLDPAGNRRVSKGWYAHPAVRMWRGSERALLSYIEAMVSEWESRGYRSTILDKALATFDRAYVLGLTKPEFALPAWFFTHGDAVARTHRVAVLSKNYDWYSQFGWVEDTGTRPESYEYLWCDSPIK
jgi:hypothetical protein